MTSPYFLNSFSKGTSTYHPSFFYHAVDVVFVLFVVVVDFVLVVLDLVFVVVELLLAETTLPPAEQGKSNAERLAIFVQKYSELPLEPTKFVPVAVISVQTSLQTILTTSLLFVPVPVTLI